MKKQLFIIAVSAALLGVVIHLAGLDENLELLTLDIRFNLFPDTAAVSEDLIIIAVDQASLESMDWLGWPWPRQIWSDLTGYLFASGAEVVYFDITFPTSSTFSASEDSVFGAVASTGKSVFITSLGREDGQPIPDNAILDIQLPETSYPYRFASPPVHDIARGATLLAAPYATPDADGTFRRFPLLFPADTGAVPSPPLALAMLKNNISTVSADDHSIFVGDVEVPFSGDYEIQVRFLGPAGSYNTIGVGDVLSAMMGDTTVVSSDMFQDAIVLIGYTASDLMDLKPMPYSARCPGVEVIANATDNILQQRFIERPEIWITVLLSLAVAAAAAAALAYIPRVIAASLAGLAVLVIYSLLTLTAFRNSDLWLPAVPPLISGSFTLLAGSVVAYRFATKEKRFLRTAFSQYLSPAVVAQVAANPETLRLGGEKRVMTAFFSDVAGFTSISEKLDPRDLVRLLNTYLTEMTDIILESGGTVDKFEGDAIIAFWGAPVEFQDHRERGTRAAVKCRKRHEDLNIRLGEEGFPELHTRIGLASGPMVVGNMGSEKRFDYTIMGSDVNLASRLEGVNKVYGTEILLADHTRQGLPEDILCREIDTVLVVGQKKPVTIWEPVDQLMQCHHNYAEALKLYRAGSFSQAEQLFKLNTDDLTSAVMSLRCREFIEKGEPENWNGVWTLTSK